MQQVDINEAQSQFKVLIEDALKGDEIIITKEQKAVVKLVSLINEEPKPIFGSAKGLIEISEDFDEPLEDFEEYME